MCAKLIDKTGMRWGKLVAVEYLGNKLWKCKCDCGNETIVNSDHLSMNKNRRSTMSCGCGKESRLTKNSNYFDIIDDEYKAYIIGFLAADGNIECNKDKSIYSIKIVVNSVDKSLLEKIKNAIGTMASIRDFEATTNLPQGEKCTSNFSSLAIHNKKLVNKLIEIGITPKKSLTLDVRYDKIPNELLRHFWRGLIDGDGSFGIYGKKNILSLTLTTSSIMANSTKSQVEKIFPNIKIGIYQAIGCNENTKRFIITKQDDVFRFLQYIYEDNNISLDRKYNNYLKIKEKFTN